VYACHLYSLNIETHTHAHTYIHLYIYIYIYYTHTSARGQGQMRPFSSLSRRRHYHRGRCGAHSTQVLDACRFPYRRPRALVRPRRTTLMTTTLLRASIIHVFTYILFLLFLYAPMATWHIQTPYTRTHIVCIYTY
jgi:hypothetical protein